MSLKAKHRRTLTAIFTRPTLAGIVFSDIETLVKAIGGIVAEGDGSRVAFKLQGSRLYLHRPHPGKEARKYQVEDVRNWLKSVGITP